MYRLPSVCSRLAIRDGKMVGTVEEQRASYIHGHPYL